MAADWYTATAFLATGLLWVMAAALLFFRCASRANRPFAAFLFVLGGTVGANAMARLTEGGLQGFWVTVHTDLQMLLLPLLAYFGLQYVRPLPAPFLAGASATVLLAGIAIQVAHAMDHCLAVCGPAGAQTAGPLFLLVYANPFWFACVGVALLASARRFAPAKRAAVALVAGGMALMPLLNGLLAIDVLAKGGAALPSSAWADAALWLRAAAALPALLSLAFIVAMAGPTGERQRRLVLTGSALLLVGLTAWFVAGAPSSGLRPSLGFFLVQAWSLLFAGIVAFALLRHRLFALDQVVKVTVSRSTMAAVLLAVFLIVSQIVEQVAQRAFGEDGGLYGTVLGGAAAGILLFALHPLERLGRRVADTVIPGDRHPKRMDDEERLRIYREQVELVWSDDVMGLRERHLLEALRARLGIAAETALGIEQAAASRRLRRKPVPRGARKQAA